LLILLLVLLDFPAEEVRSETFGAMVKVVERVSYDGKRELW
jgi:hypothetical protein